MKKIWMVGLGIFLFSFFLLPPVWGEEQAYKEFIFAQGLYEDGKFGLAAVQFQKFIEDFPENRNRDRAQYLLGACFSNQEIYE
jgi:TolA-binding protein